MFVARWCVDVKFGHKDEFLKVQKKWLDEVGSRIWDRSKMRVLNGSIGAQESRFEFEVTVPSLEYLEKSWTKMQSEPYHAKFGKELEPLIVSGSNRWEIFRAVEL